MLDWAFESHSTKHVRAVDVGKATLLHPQQATYYQWCSGSISHLFRFAFSATWIVFYYTSYPNSFVIHDHGKIDGRSSLLMYLKGPPPLLTIYPKTSKSQLWFYIFCTSLMKWVASHSLGQKWVRFRVIFMVRIVLRKQKSFKKSWEFSSQMVQFLNIQFFFLFPLKN